MQKRAGSGSSSSAAKRSGASTADWDWSEEDPLLFGESTGEALKRMGMNSDELDAVADRIPSSSGGGGVSGYGGGEGGQRKKRGQFGLQHSIGDK